jgi:hypothetical protein
MNAPLGQADAAAIADEQLGAQFPLQCDDLLRERRTRDVQPLRCPAVVQFLGDRHEVTQLPQFHGPSLGGAAC